VTARGVSRSEIASFQAELPFRRAPFASRSWGHRLHSLCSYQGKLKPSLAHWLIRQFVSDGSTILDPLGGVGTVALEGALQGHRALSNDLSPFASVVGAAKLDPPTKDEASKAVDWLGEMLPRTRLTPADHRAADFGLNSSVRDYYHPQTLDEVLRARRLFAEHGWMSREHTFMWASLLHVLHGNRPYALSRISHPITPFSPRGGVEYRSLVDRVRARIERALKEPLPNSFVPGIGLHGDFRQLGQCMPWKADAIITSPPFFGMRFDRPNWLRLWFCGWEADDFHNRSREYLERQQTHSRDVYLDFFNTMRQIVSSSGVMVVHLGSGGRGNLVHDIKLKASESFKLIGEVVESVVNVEQHGIRDKGRTVAHHLLFFDPR
jgi:hypothetical protein